MKKIQKFLSYGMIKGAGLAPFLLKHSNTNRVVGWKQHFAP
jgi:hypothetical protein